MFHLAQINIGRLVAPIDDPEIAEFVAQVDTINQLAESSPGFICRMQSEPGKATESPTIQVFRDRRNWFQKMDLPHYCLWWLPEGRIPTLIDGKLRLNITSGTAPRLRRSGSTGLTLLRCAT